MILPSLLLPWLEANGDIVQLGEWVLPAGLPPGRRLAPEHPAGGQPLDRAAAPGRGVQGGRRGRSSVSGLPAGRLTVEVTEHAMVGGGRHERTSGPSASWGCSSRSTTSAPAGPRSTAAPHGGQHGQDRPSFVGGLEAHQGINRMVVETVVSLAHSSGISTVAEGVETELQAALVREFESRRRPGLLLRAAAGSIERATDLATDARLLLSAGRRRMDGRARSGTRGSVGCGRTARRRQRRWLPIPFAGTPTDVDSISATRAGAGQPESAGPIRAPPLRPTEPMCQTEPGAGQGAGPTGRRRPNRRRVPAAGIGGARREAVSRAEARRRRPKAKPRRRRPRDGPARDRRARPVARPGSGR